MDGSDDDARRFEEIIQGLDLSDADVRREVSGVLDRFAAPTKPPPKTFPDGWYIIRVELLSARTDEFPEPPGRDILISPQHSFRQFAEVINQSFARWDLGHLYAFELADGTRIITAWEEWEEFDGPEPRRAPRTKLGTRAKGEVFGYVFDFGDNWQHQCTVLDAGVDPEDHYGVRPKGPVAVWGWGNIPDQYRRTTP